MRSKPCRRNPPLARYSRSMPSIDTVDSIEINAPAQKLFDIVLDYPRLHQWYPRYRVEVIGGGDVKEGAQLSHDLSPPKSPVKSRFTRTIQRIDAPGAIEETYDDGDLVGEGRWVFEEVAPDTTRVSFYCKVRSNSWLMHVGFALGGEMGHHMVYEELLAALKAHAEA
jgi:ribosome-associated toxin RatA of RatAB toxin-antitoxin module